MDIQQRLELMRLLSALSDGELTDPEHQRLEELLISGAEARRLYLQYVDLHVRLMSHPALGGDTVPPRRAKATADNDTTGAALELPSSGASRSFGRLSRYGLIAAAAIAALLLLQFWLWQPRTASTLTSSVPAELVSAVEHVATIAQSLDAEWEAETQQQIAAARVPPGDLRLKKGVALVRFDGGADLVVQAPATLRIESMAAAAILLGKAVFRVDTAAAARFILTTPTATLIETGSECGLEINGDREEIHVFEGQVQRLPKGSAASASPQLLTKGEARRYVATGDSYGEPTAYDVARFVRAVPGLTAAGGLLAYDGFSYTDASAIRNHAAQGGNGFSGSWESAFVIPYGFDWAKRRSSSLNVNESLLRLDRKSASAGGSYDYLGLARCYRRLATPIRMDTSATYYLSVLVCRDGPPLSIDRTNSVSVALRQASEFNRQRRRGQTESGNRLEIGFDRRDELFAQLERNSDRSATQLAYNETYLVVAKIAASADGPDQVWVKAYGPEEPVEKDEPSLWPVRCPPFSSHLVFDCLELHINSWKRQSLDEVRLGTTWHSVTEPWTN